MKYYFFLFLLLLLASSCSGSSSNSAFANTDPLIGKWLWMEHHNNGRHCIGELDVLTDGSCAYRERCETTYLEPAFVANEHNIKLSWKRVSAQAAIINVDNGGFLGIYYLHISPDQQMITLMRVNSPITPLTDDLNLIVGFRDNSGEGTIKFMNQIFPLIPTN